MSDIDERFIPGTSRITEIESFHRYLVAAELCGNCRVLDAASGNGYGSAVLAEKSLSVTGIDCNENTVVNARKKYRFPNLDFVVGDVQKMPFPDASFERVVSFETIEHVSNPECFVSEIRRVLKPEGILILSSPNKKAFDRRNHCADGENPYHIHEMECDALETLLRAYFPNIVFYKQDAFYNSVISGDENFCYYVKNTDGSFLTQTELKTTQYSFLCASAIELPKRTGSVFIDAFYDWDYGYCFDDEAVVNQFGLRGQFENLQNNYCEQEKQMAKILSKLNNSDAELKQTRIKLGESVSCQEKLQSDLEQARADLRDGAIRQQKLQSDLERAHADLRDGAIRREEIAAELEQIRLCLKEEHAKAEYLFYEYNELKKSWGLRIFGRFAIRKRLKKGMLHTGTFLYRIGKPLFLALPGNYMFKQYCKNYLYGHCGKMFSEVQGYKDWQLRRSIMDTLEQQGSDSGLIVPADLPLTSIVIPVYNNLRLTRKCLYSIYRIQSKSPFEVIIVDDCSTEDIESLKKDFPLIKIIRNEKNSGFLLTANRGGAAASGDYLIFLNNDTEVLPGWLDELTTALYHHPEAGMIGSQLIHMSTRRLQESGNLICKNGEMLPLGRDEMPDHPEFNFFREVDFCSAASIILRKKVFDEMRGFDTVYAPAYFEDPDLGLRMQKAGYKNYVMPLSRLLHQEMASYGAALDNRCQRNRKIFNERWYDYLQKHALYDTPTSMQQMRKYSRPRLLYIDAEVPMADRGSGGMDAIFFMDYFIKRGYDIVFHGEYTPGYVPKYTTILLRMGVECVFLPYRKIWEYLAGSGWRFSTVFVSRIYQARCFDRLLKKYCPQASYIFDTVDVHFVREILEAKLHNSDEMLRKAMLTKKFELQIAAAADATIVISSDEQKLLTQEYHLNNIWHIPQARDIVGLAPNQNRRGAVFIGSAHPPNMDGLRYFHDEVLPLLPKSFRLTIIGESLKKVMSESDEYRDLLTCPQFKFIGFVQDLGTVLNHALMTVAPLRYGAGTKGKVASSMSYGVPCVSSKFGTEGTGMENRKNILIAATPQEFADAIKELSSDQELWNTISDGGIEFLRRNYSRESVEAKMDALMKYVSEHHAESHWASTPVVPKEEETAEA